MNDPRPNPENFVSKHDYVGTHLFETVVVLRRSPERGAGAGVGVGMLRGGGDFRSGRFKPPKRKTQTTRSYIAQFILFSVN